MVRKQLALAVLGGVLLAGCGGHGVGGRAGAPVGPGAAPVRPGASAAPAVPAPADPSTPVVEISVTLDEYSFEPEELVVPLGAVVRLTILNVGQTRHDFNILDPYNIEGDILPSGGTQVLTFKADQAGRFPIVCSQRNHKAQGMAGFLVVQ